MGVKPQSNVADTTRTEVGEIDTRAPFESVKAAVSLFGEGAFSPYKPSVKKTKPQLSSERIFAKETQLHLSQKELNKLKEQLKNCETTRVQALSELEQAKRTVEDLTQKLKTVNESRELAISATETAKGLSKELDKVCSSGQIESGGLWQHDLENAREQYATAITELDAAKQELRKIKKDFEASVVAKEFSFQQEAESKKLADANNEKATHLSKEIAVLQESVMQVKSASTQARLEESNIIAEKDMSRQSYRLALQEKENNLSSLKNEFDPEITKELQVKLAETTAEIGALRKEMENTRVSDLDSVKSVTTELDGAKGVLQKVAEEECSLRSLLESLKLELESVKKEHLELKEKEAETESLAAVLHSNLQKSKVELEKAISGESKVKVACDDLISTLQQLTSESINAKKDAESMKNNALEIRKQSDETQMALREVEKKLQIAVKDEEDAKAAEADALNQIKMLSEKANASRSSTSECGAMITISPEEYESLSRKVEESGTLAEMKVVAAMAQVEAVRASENEAIKKLEANRKEMEEIELATKEALKRADMAEAARKAVESEMRRWREREQKKAADAASRILAETEMAKPKEVSPSIPSVLKQNMPERTEVSRNAFEKTPTMKKTLMPTLSGIFHRKKSHIGGGSPSYLPGEKPV